MLKLCADSSRRAEASEDGNSLACPARGAASLSPSELPCIYRTLLFICSWKNFPCCKGRSCFSKAGGQGQSQTPMQPSCTPGFARQALFPDFHLPVYCWCDSVSKYFSPVYSASTINATHHMLENKDPHRRAFLTSKLYLYITTVQSESLACKIGVFHIYNRYTIIY